MPNAPIIDLSNLRAIADGDEAFMRDLIDIYTEDATQQIAHLSRAVEAGDAALAERHAHSLKGASANIGAESIRALALALEQRAKAGDLAGIGADIDTLESALAATLEALRREPLVA